MKKIIVLTEKTGTKEFESMKDMFQSLSEAGEVIISLDDGILVTKTETKTFAVVITETAGTKDTLEEEVKTYRDELRASIALLQKQGIKLSKEEGAKLAKQFEFLGTAPKKEEVKQEEPSSETEEEIPVD
jgi:hypothetical protein